MATPALAERVGRWGTDQAQHDVLEMLQSDHGVVWSCSSLRKVLGSLRAGMVPHREGARVDQLVSGLEQERASTGRFRPTLAVGRDSIFVPLRRHGVWQEGATATVSVLDRRGKRVGTVYLGQMPEAGQGTRTDQRSDLRKALRSRVDSQRLRLVSGSDAGHHPSTSSHRVLQKMRDPRRPWRVLAWIRIVDFYHACQDVQQLADATFGAGAATQSGAKEMRHVLATKTDGVSRV